VVEAAAVNREEYARLAAIEETHWWYAGMRRITRAILAPAVAASRGDGRRPRLLDVGCGTGLNVAEAGAWAEALGVDVSDEALRFARARGIAVARASIEALPFGDATFDVVTSFDVLYHRAVRDDARAVRELARVLRPGGLLFVRTPALEALRRAHDDAVHGARRHSRGELRALVEGAGLRPLRISYCNTLLLPMVALRAAVDRARPARRGSDLEAMPAPVEAVLGRVLSLEARLLGRIDLPVGASLIALATKP
jgi:SAM-dependent methyltransferase